jgi:hypothetical protein
MSPDKLEQTLEALAAFFRSELFAVETYRAALEKIRDPGLRDDLLRVRNSHAGRACLLRERIDEFGGRADEVREPWGAFASVFRRIQSASDEQTTLEALREGESLGVRDYEADLVEIEPSVRAQLAAIVLGEQRRTCEYLRRLDPPCSDGGISVPKNRPERE